MASETGEDHDPETHLIPLAIDAALGRRPHVSIFGTDYDTPDGTAIRDYIHVTDLAIAHVTALRRLQAGHDNMRLNLGTGNGHSVRDVIRMIERSAAGRSGAGSPAARRRPAEARGGERQRRGGARLGAAPLGSLRTSSPRRGPGIRGIRSCQPGVEPEAKTRWMSRCGTKAPGFASLNAGLRLYGRSSFRPRFNNARARYACAMVHYRRNFVPGDTYFFTVTLADRKASLLTDRIDALGAAFRRCRSLHPFETLAIAVMPEHLHCVWTLPDGDADYSIRWSLIKRALPVVNITRARRRRARKRRLASAILGTRDPGRSRLAAPHRLHPFQPGETRPSCIAPSTGRTHRSIGM